MSDINTLVNKLERSINNESITASNLGTYIIEDLARDEDFDLLTERYPELEKIADIGNDMEYQSESYAEDGRLEVRRLFGSLKDKLKIRT